jgi:hypothetical protein
MLFRIGVHLGDVLEIGRGLDSLPVRAAIRPTVGRVGPTQLLVALTRCQQALWQAINRNASCQRDASSAVIQSST